MSIVVTGGCGFLGRTLVPHLQGRDQPVVVMDRRPWPMPASAEDYRASPTVLTGELTAPSEEMRDALAEAEAVVHLAGCPGVRDREPDVARRRRRDNVDAAASVLALTPADTPVVVLSSSSVYGGTVPAGGAGAPRPSHEDDPLRPRGGYAASKVATERVCWQRAASGGHVLVVRPFTVLGEGQRPDMAVARWAHEARTTGRVTVLGSPERTRDFTDVRDVAASLTALLHSGRTGMVNLGTGRPRTLYELASAVCAAAGAPPRITLTEAAPCEVPHTAADTRRLLAWTGSTPVTDLDDVVARAVASITGARADAEVAA